MKATDYVVLLGAGQQEVTFTPKSDRAKQRTAEAVTFRERASALEYMRAAEIEGYRFLNARNLDTTRELVKYGYFLKGADGDLIQAHRKQNWGPLDTDYEPGDNLGIEDGKEGIILDVLTDAPAVRFGIDVAFVLEERDNGAMATPPAPERTPIAARKQHLAGIVALLGVSAVLLVPLVGIGAIVLDYFADLKSDEIVNRGGRNHVHDWLTRDDLLDKVKQNKAPFTQCAPLASRQAFSTLIVWVFGDGYLDYSDVQTGNGAIGGGADTWGHAKSILMVKLTGGGTETHQVTQVTKDNPLPGIGPYKNEEIRVYDAEAWLVDKQTRQCLGHETFKPGPDSGGRTIAGAVLNPFVTYRSVKDLRFRAVAHAVAWATP
jgi:hypothetical protein